MRFLTPLKKEQNNCSMFSLFNIYASSCVALALCRGDGHRKLVTRFGVYNKSIIKGLFFRITTVK